MSFGLNSDIPANEVHLFSKWLWIFDWIGWILVENVQFPIFSPYWYALIILHGVNCKFIIIITHTKEKPSTTINIFGGDECPRSEQNLRYIVHCYYSSTPPAPIQHWSMFKSWGIWMPVHQDLYQSFLISKRNRLQIKSLTLYSLLFWLLYEKVDSFMTMIQP